MTTGKALTGAAASSSLGFGVLYFAQLNIFSTFGVLTALMVIFSLIGSMLMLPLLLVWYYDRKLGTNDSEEGTGPQQSPIEAE